MNTALIVTAVVLSTIAIVVVSKTSRRAYATAPFKRERSSGKFELRD
jgi:hypothetical protein